MANGDPVPDILMCQEVRTLTSIGRELRHWSAIANTCGCSDFDDDHTIVYDNQSDDADVNVNVDINVDIDVYIDVDVEVDVDDDISSLID